MLDFPHDRRLPDRRMITIHEAHRAANTCSGEKTDVTIVRCWGLRGGDAKRVKAAVRQPFSLSVFMHAAARRSVPAPNGGTAVFVDRRQ